MPESFLKGITPFIQNMKKGQKGTEPATKKITENGKYDTIQNSKVDVKVEKAEELTPEAQQEILEEEY